MTPPMLGGERQTEEVLILANHDGVVLAYKPAALPTESTPRGQRTLVAELSALLGGRAVHAASRLDVGVSGVVLCTVGRSAARRAQQWRDAGELKREYVAIAAVKPDGVEDEGSWEAPLGRLTDRAGRHKASTRAHQRRPARTGFRVIARCSAATLLSLLPETGRMHQLRAHAAIAGLPIYGDRLYGGTGSIVDDNGKVHELDRIALHALHVEAPTVAATAPLPEAMRAMWRALGGESEAWSSATGACAAEADVCACPR